jgi:hypothetical protein
MKHRLFSLILACIVALIMWLPRTEPVHAQASPYFFTATHLGGGACGTNLISVPTRFSWNFSPPNTIATFSGTFSVNGGPATPFTTISFNMGASSGSVNLFGVLPPGANTGGTNTYTYVETDFVSVAGIPLGGQTYTVVCNAGTLVSASITNFGPGGQSAGQFFHSGDERIDPRPGDRLAVYCNQKAQIVVYGIDNGQIDTKKGFLLGVFKHSDVKLAGDNGLTKNLGENGTLSISLIKGWYWVAWNGGKFNATGKDIWVKNFPESACTFAG